MSLAFGIAATGISAALIVAAIVWCLIPSLHNREQRHAPYEHARLTRQQRREWRRIKRSNRDVKALACRIKGVHVEAKR